MMLLENPWVGYGVRQRVEITFTYCAEFLFVFKAGKGAHSELCKPFPNEEYGQKDK